MVVNSSQVWRHPFLFICACASCSALNLYSTFWQPINHQGLQVEKERENPVRVAWKRGNLGKQSAQHLCMWTRSRVLCMMPLLMLHNTKGGVYKLPQHVNNILWMKDARGKWKGKHMLLHTRTVEEISFSSVRLWEEEWSRMPLDESLTYDAGFGFGITAQG